MTGLPKVFSDYDWAAILPVDDPEDDSRYTGTYDACTGKQVADITRGRIARVDLWDIVRGSCATTDLCALVELTDGTWAACMAWCDTTGWGCQAGVQWKWAPTRDGAISQGLDRDARRRLGVALPHEEGQEA